MKMAILKNLHKNNAINNTKLVISKHLEIPCSQNYVFDTQFQRTSISNNRRYVDMC
jgi:hypothetical protein